jgi:hypothetical protein
MEKERCGSAKPFGRNLTGCCGDAPQPRHDTFDNILIGLIVGDGFGAWLD